MGPVKLWRKKERKCNCLLLYIYLLYIVNPWIIFNISLYINCSIKQGSWQQAKLTTPPAIQGLTLRSERHLLVGQVKVMFYLPSAHGHLSPKYIYICFLFFLHDWNAPYVFGTILGWGKLKKWLLNPDNLWKYYFLYNLQFRHLADTLNPERLTVGISTGNWLYSLQFTKAGNKYIIYI